MRTLLLALHITGAAAWVGADLVQHALTPSFERASAEVVTAWTRAQLWLHDRYYPVVVAVLLGSGIALVQHGHWSWSARFVWVGIGALTVGASIGGGGLATLLKRRLAAFASGDAAAATLAQRRLRVLGVVATIVPLVAILAMVGKWGA